jgi:hypothetical protein
MGDDGGAGRRERGVAVGVIEMPVRVDVPFRFSRQGRSDRSPDFGDARPVTRIDDSDGLGPRDRGHSTARAGKHEEAGADLVAQQRRSLIGGPGLGDEPVQRKALPELGAWDVIVFAHLGLFLRGLLSCKAPETAGAKIVWPKSFWQGRIGPPVGGGEAATGL